MPNVAIYCLIDPRDGSVRYVGLTTLSLSKRLSLHISETKKKSGRFSVLWMRKLLAEGFKPLISLIESDVSPDREEYWITQFNSSGAKLTNMATGGECGAVGVIRSEHVRAKMSAAQKGNKRRQGQINTDEHNKKIAIALTGNKNSKGIIISDKVKQKIRQSLMGHTVSQDTRDKISVSLTGRKRSEESIRKTAASNTGQKRKPHSEEAKRKMREAALKRTPEQKAATAATVKRLWSEGVYGVRNMPNENVKDR